MTPDRMNQRDVDVETARRTPEMKSHLTRPEIPACAAMRRIDANGYEIILAGKRHIDCFSAANVSGLGKLEWEQGFMTTLGRFVDRHEAFRLQAREDLPSASPDGYRAAHGLFSEDLY